MAPKVSIVIPTYAPGDRIEGLVRSLEAQTMPTSEFEVIFVDDGSPDDTWTRLLQLRDTHDNVRIERIENSGWPSRPRNVGLELARGEYVLFMDHDDELYPRALEAGHAMAARTGADVLNGKETRTDQSKWALEVYAENLDNAIDRTDLHPLIPTNPHKLFRRELLMSHGVRFPEGRRVLWEDVFFALDVAQHAEVISVMADTPFYHWVRGAKTASSSYTKDQREYWRWVREIVVQTNEKLAAPHLRQQWRLMLLHQYRSRMLATIGAKVFTAEPGIRDFVLETASELVADHIPVELDAYLTPTQLGRATLIRAGRWDLLERLVPIDAGLVGISTARSARWSDGVLQLEVESRWNAGGKPLALRFDGPGGADGGRVVRDLPDDIAAALPDAALDMTASLLAARTGIGVRARDTAINWMLPGTCTPRIEAVDGRPELVVSANAQLDPATAAFGRPLDSLSWDVTARNELVGTINQRNLRTALPGRVAVQSGHAYVAYKNQSTMLSLDLDETNRSLVGSAKLDPNTATSTPTGSSKGRWPLAKKSFGATFSIAFSGVATRDDTVLRGTTTVGRGETRPARVVARDTGLWLESSFEQPPGTYPLTVQIFERAVDAAIDVTIAPSGAVTFARRAG